MSLLHQGQDIRKLIVQRVASESVRGVWVLLCPLARVIGLVSYAHMLLVVALLVVKIFSFLIIASEGV